MNAIELSPFGYSSRGEVYSSDLKATHRDALAFVVAGRPGGEFGTVRRPRPVMQRGRATPRSRVQSACPVATAVYSCCG